MPSQLLATKSIDKLISESEQPEHRLKKSLGPWSLTALGIGAIIGSGIFVLTGTAAAGEHSTLSIWHAQVADIFANLIQHGSLAGTIMHGGRRRGLPLPCLSLWWQSRAALPGCATPNLLP